MRLRRQKWGSSLTFWRSLRLDVVMDSEVPMASKLSLLFSIPYPASLPTTLPTDTIAQIHHEILAVRPQKWYLHRSTIPSSPHSFDFPCNMISVFEHVRFLRWTDAFFSDHPISLIDLNFPNSSNNHIRPNTYNKSIMTGVSKFFL